MDSMPIPIIHYMTDPITNNNTHFEKELEDYWENFEENITSMLGMDCVFHYNYMYQHINSTSDIHHLLLFSRKSLQNCFNLNHIT